MDPTQDIIAAYDQLAEAYQAKFMDLDIYDASYARLLALLPSPQSKVLELGCGPGNITHHLLRQRPDLQILATDAAPNMVALAQQNNPTAKTKVLAAHDLATLTDRYDAVVCGFLLPYLSQAQTSQLIHDSVQLLAPGGILYLSAIEGDYAASGLTASSDGRHHMYVYLHEAAFLLQALQAAGLISLETMRIPYPKAGGVVDVHLILLAQRWPLAAPITS